MFLFDLWYRCLIQEHCTSATSELYRVAGICKPETQNSASDNSFPYLNTKWQFFFLHEDKMIFACFRVDTKLHFAPTHPHLSSSSWLLSYEKGNDNPSFLNYAGAFVWNEVSPCLL